MKTALSKIVIAIVLQATVTTVNAQQKDFEGKVEYTVSQKSKTEFFTDQQVNKMHLLGDAQTFYYKNGKVRKTTPFGDVFYFDSAYYYKFPGVDTLYQEISSKASMEEIDLPDSRIKVLGIECIPVRLTSGVSIRNLYYPVHLDLSSRFNKDNAKDLETLLDGLFFPFLKLTTETPISKFELVCTSLEEKKIPDSLFMLPRLPIRDYKTQSISTAATFKLGDIGKYVNRQIDGNVAGKHLKIKRGQKEVRQTVYVSFTISEKGKLINPFIVNAGEVHKKIAEETLRVISSSPSWWPAKYKGEAYASQMYLPVVYVVSE